MASQFPNCETAMASHPLNCRRYLVFTYFFFLSLLISLPFNTHSLSFSFPSFDVNNPGLVFQGEASISNSILHLTRNQPNASTGYMYSIGRALYPTEIQLWDNSTTKRLTDFTTQFNYTIAPAGSSQFGDGFTFLLIPENTALHPDAYGGSLGMYDYSPFDFSFTEQTTIVAVEIDAHQNQCDPSNDHIGIDVNSVKSAAYTNVSEGVSNKSGQVFVSYDSMTKRLSASLRLDESSVLYSVSHIIDLSTVLPRRVQVGFSASTGSWVERHQIHSWSFNSTLEDSVAPQQERWSKSKGGLVAGIGVGIFFILIFGTAIVWFILRRKRPTEGNMDKEFDEDAGPKKFAYSKLSRATNNFAIEGKLGEGGFGGVYKGVLEGPGNKEIAVKKIKNGSDQGPDEYISEVKIISKLRHRNLVQLLGWCHDRGELLLVYEFMPNRSLDFHLFNGQALLRWQTRYKIALGLASALLYLHEECEKYVVHRDIKSSNVMLDSYFNPKLGDFGLARLVDHDVGLKTTRPAGTRGYLAPECIYTGKVSKESDVYSFGIVALELACGRRVIEVREEHSRLNLVEWVRDLYGKGLILESVDSRLDGVFNVKEANCLLVVGLWCSYPDVSNRPSIKKAISALNFETPLPSFNSFPPQNSYVSPEDMNMPLLSSSSTNISNHRIDD